MIKLRHTGITTQNMERSLQLYRDIFGLEIVWDEIEQSDFIDRLTGMKDVKVHTVKLKDQKGAMIELLHFLSHPDEDPQSNMHRELSKIGCSHIAITVDDIHEMYLKLKALGFTFNNKPERHPDINVPAIVAYCRDTEGTLIEIVEVIK
jgi:glyoxylase I family protein